jgi:glycosyltransferase involved in cell wall biosynthesis
MGITSSPSTTVLINNHNYGRYLKQAIDSALTQACHNLEIIVVDDGSTDESRSILRDYDGRVQLIFQPNGGQASAFNAGFTQCRGEVICFLDSDDWFLPGKVGEVARAFELNPQVQWVFHPVQMTFPDGRTEISPSEMQSTLVDMRQQVAMQGKMKIAPAPPTSGLSFRRGVLSKILPMTESIRITSDNFLKLAAMSLSPGLYLDKALSAQRIHEANAYTLRKDRLLTQARIHLLIARELRDRFPITSRLSDKVFARALAEYIVARGWERQGIGAIKWYFRNAAPADILGILPRTLYHLGRTVMLGHLGR